jgi:hypothetical protein
MTYYPTLEEDLARAKEILAKGKPAHDEVAYLAESVKAAALPGGAIYGGDNYAAYKLLESFVAEIERLRVEIAKHLAYFEGTEAALEQLRREATEQAHSFELYHKASMALMHAYKRAHPDVPELVWPDATTVNVWAAEQIDELPDLTSRLLDMLERVEWVRQQGGSRDVCPFCHAIGERDDGPGHQDDCEWQLVTRQGNELRLKGLLR